MHFATGSVPESHSDAFFLLQLVHRPWVLYHDRPVLSTITGSINSAPTIKNQCGRDDDIYHTNVTPDITTVWVVTVAS